MKDKTAKNAYYKSYMKQLRAKRRLEVVMTLGGKCVVCGSCEALEIDHIDRTTKTVPIADALSWSKSRLMAEAEKCQLLCASHHQEKTTSERSVEHGGGLSGKKNCKCPPCKQIKAKYTAERRASKQASFTGGLMARLSAVNGKDAGSTPAP